MKSRLSLGCGRINDVALDSFVDADCTMLALIIVVSVAASSEAGGSVSSLAFPDIFDSGGASVEVMSLFRLPPWESSNPLTVMSNDNDVLHA